jgi:hypothetical protein
MGMSFISEMEELLDVFAKFYGQFSRVLRESFGGLTDIND